mgnify:FL=1
MRRATFSPCRTSTPFIVVESQKINNAVHLLVLVPFGLVFSFVVLPIQHEIVVASYHYLVLVREAFKKIPEAIDLPTIGVLREIASMNEDVSWWQAVDVDTIVTIVGVRHRYDSNHFR